MKDKKGGQTPLYLAVKSGQVEVARLLIQVITLKGVIDFLLMS